MSAGRVPDGVFAEDGAGLRFEMLPVPTNANVLAILDRLDGRNHLVMEPVAFQPVTFAPARSPPQAELAWDEAS